MLYEVITMKKLLNLFYRRLGRIEKNIKVKIILVLEGECRTVGG